MKTTTPSLNDQILALTHQGVSLEEAARKVLDGESPARQSTALTDLSLDDEITTAMYTAMNRRSSLPTKMTTCRCCPP